MRKTFILMLLVMVIGILLACTTTSSSAPLTDQEETQIEAEATRESETTEKADEPPTESAPTSEPEGAKFALLSESHYENSAGYIIVGELQNIGDIPGVFVEVLATAYDETGEVVTTGFSYALIGTINPKEKSPFQIYLDKDKPIADYRLDAQWQNAEAPSTVSEEIKILSHSSSVNSAGFIIDGEIQNISSGEAHFVQIIATGYDSEGTVVAVSSTYSQIETLKPQQKSPFRIYLDNADRIKSYELAVWYD